MSKVMYSKSKMLDKGLLSVEQTLPQVLYYIFKEEELVYIGITDNFSRRYQQHFSMVGNKVLYKSMRKHGADIFDMYIAEEFQYRDSVLNREKEAIQYFKGIGLAKYNIENIFENINSTNKHVQPYRSVDAKEAIDVANKRSKLIRDEVIRNIEKSIMSNVLDYDTRELEMYLTYRISTLNKNKDRYMSSYSERAYERYYDDLDYEQITYNHTDIDRVIETLVDIIGSFIYSPIISTEIHNEYYEYVKDIIEYMYDTSTPIEQYIFVLLFLGMYDIDDVTYVLNIDRNELNEHLVNILGEGLVTYSMHEELFNQGVRYFDK